MKTKQTFVTEEGLKKLNDELHELKTIRRPEVTAAIKKAKGFGDLSENSEYDEAKNEQAEVERRIAELEELLSNVQIINNVDNSVVVTIGSKVKIYDCEFDEEIDYTIVGSTEADPLNNRISDESPIGKALMGKKEGEEVMVETPGGIIKIKVVKLF